ncbi:MAG: protein kinase, partial [Gammaproteobacteria bacterium]|nr:protein kinase [Gammaproteobacteria bacterium]
PLARLHPLLAAPAPPPLRARAPLARFRERTAGIGVVPPGQPPRRALLAYPVGEEWVPSFALAVAARAMRVPAKRVRLVGRTGVEVGDVAYATDRRFGFYPRPVNRDGTPVETFSLAALWDPGVEVAGKTVLIGPTAGSLVAPVSGPGGRAHAPVVWAAHAVDSLLEGHRITVPAWFHGAQRALILLVALYLALLPQRLHGRAGLFTALAIGLLALNAAVVVLLTRLLWLPITVPVAFLGVAQIALWGRFRLAGLLAHSRDEAARTHQVLGKTLQAQGRLEDAFEEFKQCPVTEEVLGVLYELGLDLERRRQFTKALAVYEYMGAYAEHRDIKARAQRLRSVTTPVPRASSAANAGTATVVMDAAGIEKPMLGRYRLEREIGRGAMGMVYLGKDPKIGRRVAIKTLALSEEFEGGQLEEVQKRFFREAAAAGRLNHPHIVTIYDVGEESDLAYIAMDYIEGDSLDRHTSAEQLLPVPEVLEIGAQVAEALGYAHGKQVVHRDVKPGNMLYDRRTRAVKVTDFGVAYLIDSSKTRTGTVLGSPSYMSPEQVAGDKLDGRSDLFSLGVTLYQLLTGRLPFQGESVANLMYRITNENPPDIRKVRSDLAPCVARVVHRALQKEASKRYAGGDSMAEALRRCRIEAMGGRAKDNRQ